MQASRRSPRRAPLAAVPMLFLLGFMTLAIGCSSTQESGPRAAQRFGPGQLSTEAINAIVIDFADDHVLRIQEQIEGLVESEIESDDRISGLRTLLDTAYASVDIATTTNPIVGMSDMYVMVSLSREAARRRAIDRTLTRSERSDPRSFEIPDEELEPLLRGQDRALIQAFDESVRDMRRVAEQVLWPEQITQLEALVDEWWAQNPARRRVTHVRLDDFAEYRAARVQTSASGPRNLLGLLYLDPLASMDPTTREIAQTRMLAERVTFQISRMPMIISLNARVIMYEALTADEVVTALNAVEQVANNSDRFAAVAESLPDDVAAERDAALQQIAATIQIEREAAIEQLAAAVETERAAAIIDLEAAVARQRDATLAALDEQSESLQGTLGELRVAVESATTLTQTANDTVRAIDDMNIENFQRLIETANESVASVERSLGAVERLATPGAVDTQASGIDQSVSVAADSLGVVVDQVFWRAVQLVGVIAVVGVLGTVLVRKVAPRQARGAA